MFEPKTLEEVIKHPFTGLYWDFQTKSYMFFVCGILVTRLSPDGKILYVADKDMAR